MAEPSTRSTTNNYPHIIELAGVAGAGKSTLRNAMMQKNGRIKTLPLPLKVYYVRCLIKIAFTWLPLYLKEYRHTRWFTLQQVRNIGYLDTWISIIRSKNRTAKDIILIDPGAVYWLSDLQEFGPEITQHPRFQNWWRNRLAEWSSALDAIIWLDAPAELCVQRVQSRDEEHPIKQLSFEMGLKELKCLRERYGRLIPEMASRNGLKVRYFRSDQISTRQMIDQLFSDSDLKGILTNSHETTN